MKYSQLFTKTKKQAPKDELTSNAKLLVQAGFVHKTMAGVYSYLPLGLKVLRKIENIIREEMNAIGGQEVFLPALHPAENWKQSGGWDSIDVLFKIKSRTGKDYALGQSHEEVITPLMKEFINSYKNLPVFVYQIQEKYRDELRAKSGVLRGREFGMKDMYSFHSSQKDFDKFYERSKKAYLKIFSRCGLLAKATEASGGDFSQKISFEFMVLTQAGEDDILYCELCEYCINVDIAKVKEGSKCPKCKKGKLKKARASEVGNVFDLGQKYTKAFDLYVLDEKGKKIYPIMGCYGIGTTRLLGVIAEKCNDEYGLIWPESVAPYQVCLISLPGGEVFKLANVLYQTLRENNIEVLWDDRIDVSTGQKFADADLIGIPIRLVVSDKLGDKVEWKERHKKEKKMISTDQVLKKLQK
ncbi:aminoacyl--tRNA ligase-related protein [Patescibacteria group bacterium]